VTNEIEQIFTTPLANLGKHESPQFEGVMSPVPEIGAQRIGVTAEFLENAEDYYQRHQGFEYWRSMLQSATQSLDISTPSLIVEYGCGFGNATLPLLDMFPEAKVAALDISPNLLAILHRLLSARSLDHRCLPVAADAHKPYVKESVADLVVGSAILHHLVQPENLIDAAIRVLKPGGYAIFFEPFEGGYAMLRLIIRDMCKEAAIREFASPALSWLAEMSAMWLLQIKRDMLPGWKDLDDKWMFSRPYFQRIATRVGAELSIQQKDLPSEFNPFRSMLLYIIQHWRGLDPRDPTNMPQWAWSIVDQYENDLFSEGQKEDLMFSGTVIFKKK